SSSAPDEALAMMSFVLPASIGSEQVTTTLPATSPACFSTSSIRDQCTASSRASASLAASAGARFASSLSSQLLELFVAPGVAENDVMSDSREDRSELTAHQPRTQNTDAHAALPRAPFVR